MSRRVIGMAETLTPDICVIGGGPGAASAVLAAAAFGVPVVFVRDRSAGTHRDVSTLALLAAAKRVKAMRGSGAFGAAASIVGVDFPKVRDHVQRVVAAVAPNESVARLTGLGVRVIDGAARFKDRRTIMVGGICEIRARRFIIATGSHPMLPPIPGLDRGVILTGETVLALAEQPEHLLIIGAGSTGLEIAQIFRRLGSAVTVLEAAQPLASDDPECAGIVLDQLAREGVAIRSGVKVARIERACGKVQAILEGIEGEESIEGTHLLVAAGEKPALDGLDLEVAAINYNPAGIAVNASLKTSNKRVYAIGGVTAQPRFSRAAGHHAGLAIQNALLRRRVRADSGNIPWVTFTDPELAQAGMTEAEARERGIKVRISRWPYTDNDRAQAERETRGHIKVVMAKNGKIVGVTIVGAAAGELIAAWALAIAQGLNISAFTDFALPSPTLSEIDEYVAFDFFSQRLTSSWVRRIIAWLRIFG